MENENGNKATTLEEMLKRATPASRIGPAFDMVELPTTKDDEDNPAVFVVRAVDLDVILIGTDGLPAIFLKDEDAAKVPDAMLKSRIEKWNPGAALIAEAGILAPEVSFGPEPETDKVWWHGLPFRDRMEVVSAINRVSGFGKKANKRIATFPAVEAGGAGGGSDPTPGNDQVDSTVGATAGS